MAYYNTVFTIPELVCVSVLAVKLLLCFLTAALVLLWFLFDAAAFSPDLKEFPRATTDIAFSVNLENSLQLQ